MFQSLQRPPHLPLSFGLTHKLQEFLLHLFQTLQVPLCLFVHALLLLPDQIDISLLPIAGLLEHLLQLVLRLLV
jgi:hypothetical protein